MDLSELTRPEGVRKRPEMFIYNTGFQGFLAYMEIAYQVNLRLGATQLDIERIPQGFRFVSNAEVTASQIQPIFEDFYHHAFERVCAPALAALSTTLRTRCGSDEICYECGLLKHQETQETHIDGLQMEFLPDTTILKAYEMPIDVWRNELRKKSYLYPKVRFRLSIEGSTTEFHAPTGIRSLFDSISTLYQMACDPIDLDGAVDDFRLRVVFSLHYSQEPAQNRDETIWSYANLLPTVKGCHVDGFLSGVHTVAKQVFEPADLKIFQWLHIVAVLAIESPDVKFVGGNLSVVRTSKIRLMTENLVIQLFRDWLENNPAFLHQLSKCGW